jgi:hypothetical protein
MKKKPRVIPRIFYFSLCFFLIGILLSVVYRKSAAFAGAVNGSVAHAFRFVLGSITSVVSFSVAEILVFSIPLLAILAVVISFIYAKTARRRVRMLAVILSILMPLYPLYMLTLAPGYHAPTLDVRMDLSADPVSAEELRDTALWLTDEINELTPDIYFASDGASIMPYSLDEMSEKLMLAYDKLCQKQKFLQSFNSRIKPALISVIMSHAHTTGVYSFFTGEANLNVDFPDYTLPFTAAHEFAHQRGIARENEANFVAFLVCAESDDAYIRYSGYLNLYEYVVNALYSASKDMYKDVRAQLAVRATGEMKAYSVFYDQYRESEISKVSTSINNAYLQANGTQEGTKSYGMVVDLAVAYHKTNK